MKIKLAVLEKDTSYLNRFIPSFSVKYADKIEIYAFSEKEVALATLNDKRIDVFLASDSYEIDVNKLPKRCSFAYFTEIPNIEIINEQQAISKFQKMDSIYKQILNLYSENEGNISGLKTSNEFCKTVVFTSPIGGVGSSSLAAACAIHFAIEGKKTLYLNLENYGYADEFFEAEGQFGMSDVIFALKNKKAKLAVKLESYVKQDKHGVYFYSKSENALHMSELKTEEMIQLLTLLKRLGVYEYIILDMDFSLDKENLNIYKEVNEVIWVSDGSQISNDKLCRAYQTLMTLEMNMEDSFMKNTNVLYNRFHSKKGQIVKDLEIRLIGGTPCIQYEEVSKMLEELAKIDVFDKIFQ